MVIGIFNFKGGVGKTFIASNLAMLLAYYKHRTCLMDMDPQGDAMKWTGGQSSPGVWNWDGELDKMTSRGVDLVWGAHPKYEGTTPEIPQGYEFVILDCRPDLTIMEQVMDVLDMIIIPVKGRLSWDAAAELKKVMDALRPEVPVYVLKNEILPLRMVASREEIGQLNLIGIRVFEWGFVHDGKVRSAELMGVPVWEIPYGSHGAILGVLRSVCSEILHLETPKQRSMRRAPAGARENKGKAEVARGK